jgi:hypothetical protein
VVGATGFEPVTSSVSGHARPFARSVVALHRTRQPCSGELQEAGTTVRRESTHGIAADKLLTMGPRTASIRRTSVRARRPIADRSSCGSTAGPFSKVEGLFAMLMCADCQAARGHGSGPYPVMTHGPDGDLGDWSRRRPTQGPKSPMHPERCILRRSEAGVSAAGCRADEVPDGNGCRHPYS